MPRLFTSCSDFADFIVSNSSASQLIATRYQIFTQYQHTITVSWLVRLHSAEVYLVKYYACYQLIAPILTVVASGQVLTRAFALCTTGLN